MVDVARPFARGRGLPVTSDEGGGKEGLHAAARLAWVLQDVHTVLSHQNKTVAEILEMLESADTKIVEMN